MACDVLVAFFSWSTIRIKAFEKKREKASIGQKFWLKVLILRIFWTAKVLMAWNISSQPFICRTFFSTCHWKMLSTISASRKDMSLLSTKWIKLIPKISDIFGPGLEYIDIKQENFQTQHSFVKLDCKFSNFKTWDRCNWILVLWSHLWSNTPFIDLINQSDQLIVFDQYDHKTSSEFSCYESIVLNSWQQDRTIRTSFWHFCDNPLGDGKLNNSLRTLGRACTGMLIAHAQTGETHFASFVEQTSFLSHP